MKIIDCLNLGLDILPRQAVMLSLVAQAPKEIPPWFRPQAMTEGKLRERAAAWPWYWAEEVLEAEPDDPTAPPTDPADLTGTPD